MSRKIAKYFKLGIQLSLLLLGSFGVLKSSTQADSSVSEKKENFIQNKSMLKVPDIQRSDFFEYDFGTRNKLNPRGYKTSSKFDKNAENIKSIDLVDSNEISYPYNLSLDDYIVIRRDQLRQKLWDSMLTRYDLKKALTQGDLASVVSQATGLTIPVPPNPVMNLFGKPEISLNVNGEVNVTIGWRWDSQNLGTVSQFGQTQSSPIFNQDIKVNVSGKIGDKLQLGTDWNTRRNFDDQNTFKIGFDGYDDDIIKKVELGNIQFNLPTTLIRGGESLFGARADFQFGPLYLKSVFSQKRGQSKFIDVRGGVSKQEFSIRAYDYAKNNFFLDTVYMPIYDAYFKNSTPVLPKEGAKYSIKEIEVYESSNDIADQAKFSSGTSLAIDTLPPIAKGTSYDNSIRTRLPKAGEVVRANFVRMDTTKYKVNFNLGTITIRNLRPDRYYAVAYRMEGDNALDNSDDMYVGTLSSVSDVNNKDSSILKLIYHPNLQPGFRKLWKRQMKNIFDVNSRNVNVADTKINIWYINKRNDSSDVLEGAPDKLVTIFNVDQVNNGTGAAPADGIFDLKPPFFDPVEGTITFPHTRPFDSLLVRYFTDKVKNPSLADVYTFSAPYDTTYDVARLNTARDRFVITGEVSGRQTNRISLGAFNLAKNSVRVSLDGVQLIENQDYVVDYYSGTVTMRNPRATVPGANLKVEYEQRDIFNIATKTMAGLRGDFSLYKTRNTSANLGFTFMWYDQSAIIDRVRINEEPISNIMMGFDGELKWNTPWLTEALDYLPFYDTKVPSNINLKGEWALMLPTPNKRSSEITSDNGEPVVFIDDFDGSQRYISLGLNPTQWQHSSALSDSSGKIDPITAYYRSKMFWFQYFIPRVPIQDIYPDNTNYTTGRNYSNPMHLVFIPDERGIYNPNPYFIDSLNKNDFNPNNQYSRQDTVKPKLWGGMQRLLSSFNTNFDTENIEYIEVMMRINYREPTTKFYLDIGQISEDIIPNGLLNTEDGITSKNPLPNGIIDEGEDIGLDTLNNDKEKLKYSGPMSLEPDPARDDYSFDFNKNDQDRNDHDFRNYNNFEGNSRISESGQFPDSEILNTNNGQSITLDNSFFTYEIKLSQYDFEAEQNEQIVGGNPKKGWFLYRIPIRKPDSKVGNPLFSNIQYIRLRVQGGAFNAEIENWRLVGSQWQRISNLQDVKPNDSTLSIGFVNLWENSKSPDFYNSPPGVNPPKQLNNPDPLQDVKLNEQSISIGVKNLKYGEERMAVRIFRAMDLFYYKKMKFFIHGDGSMPESYVKGSTPKAYAFLRFGIDSSNYYEYRRPLLRGWQDLEIDVNQLTAIKQERDSTKLYDIYRKPVPGDNDAEFIIKGNPILTRVQFFGMGLNNPADRFPNELTTNMWVDELRMITPEATADWAGLGTLNMTLADLGQINASFQTSQPNFHQLEERFGARVSSANWTVALTGNLEKFAPKSFNQMKIPIAYTHSEIMQTPQYAANNDINLNEAATQAYNNAISSGKTQSEAADARDNVITRSQTMKVSDNFSLTGVKLGIPVKHWLINETFNKLTLGYSYSQEYERTPIYQEKFNWIWRLTAQYGTSIPEILTLEPLKWLEKVPFFSAYSKWKINFLPSSISADLTMTRRRQTEQSRYLEYPSPVLRDFTAIRKFGFNWKFSDGGLLSPSLDYTVTTNSTLAPYEFDELGRQRTGSDLASAILFKGGVINFGKNTLHNQVFTLNLKPILPDIFSIHKYFDITGSFVTTYNWYDPLQSDSTIRDIVKVANYNNSIRFNLGFRMKQFGDYLFGVTTTAPVFGGRKGVSKPEPDSVSKGLGILGVFKSIIFDWEKIDFTFNQSNSSINPGVYGKTGFDNFWVQGFSFGPNLYTNGPSMAYQLGLIDNPHGAVTMSSSSAFPFVRFGSTQGKRPADARLQDNYRQTSTLEIKTSRPLWEGATLDLNWKTDVSFNKNQTVVTDASGNPSFTNIQGTESFNRTFLCFPSLFGFNPFGNTIDNVIELYNEKKTGIMDRFNKKEIDQVEKNQELRAALSESFYNGLEAFSIFGKGSAGKFMPSMNWGIRWEGLEKWDMFKKVIKKLSFDHSYQSTFMENAQITDNGRATMNQIIQYGFQPLIGLNGSFDEDKFDGLLTATFRWISTKSFQINSAAQSTVSSTGTDELTAQASYTMKGFEFPLFGINLKNDFELSFLMTYKNNSNTTFNIADSASTYTGENKDGRTLNGNTQIILEPRARYSLSQRLNASFFVRYEGTFTEGASTPGFHTTSVGLEVRLSVAGGR